MRDDLSPPPELVRARQLVLRFGWNATAYQILNPGIRLWFSGAGDAVAGYVDAHGVRVVAGAPVCAGERLGRVVAELEEAAAAGGRRVCYFCAGERLREQLARSTGHSRMLIGAQPAWNPDDWPVMLRGHASLRAQLNRARNKGVEVSEWPSRSAHGHPELRRCLDEWLGGRGLPPLHFLVEPDTLSRLYDRRVFVAARDGRPVGFLVASPVPLREGWLIEQIIRGRAAPNGTAELLIDAAVRAVAADGCEYVTLGLSPLSTRAGGVGEGGPLWLRGLLRWLRAHARRFYNFRGLESFKAKFRPAVWEPIYAIANEPRFAPGTLYAVAEAFTDGSVPRTLGRALTAAATQELTWLRERLRG